MATTTTTIIITPPTTSHTTTTTSKSWRRFPPSSIIHSTAHHVAVNASTPISSKDIEQAKDYGTFRPKPILVRDYQNRPDPLVLLPPFISPLIFDNSASDARDHCANERNFLSYLRLSVYLTIISIAITLSFHFNSQPTSIEKRMALPLGLIFWILSFVTLVTGLVNYFGTVEKYRRQRAVVENGIVTNIVFGVVGVTILATCIILLESGPSQGS